MTGLLVTATLPVSAANVNVLVQETHGTYHVHGTFTAEVPAPAAWTVLADYEHIGAFVRSVHASRFVTASDGTRVLQQDLAAGVFPFGRTLHVELSLLEDPGSRIEFRDVLGRDFRHYSGVWVVRAGAAGTEVAYDLEAEPRAGVPRMLGREVMSHDAEELLREVRAEMLHRSAGGQAPADDSATH